MKTVRNFWLEAEVDGKATKIAGGPRSKRGGMKIRLLNRENGKISGRSIEIECKLNEKGELVVVAFDGDIQILHKVTSR